MAIFYIFHLIFKPYVTENLNKLNLELDLSLIFIILVRIFANNSLNDKNTYYFSMIFVLLIKLIMILKIILRIGKIILIKHQNKIIKRFRSISPYLKRGIDIYND